jgi:hypothetical protein
MLLICLFFLYWSFTLVVHNLKLVVRNLKQLAITVRHDDIDRS